MPSFTHTARMMLGNIVVFIALVALSGCGSRLETTIISEDIPPKPPVTEAAQPKAPEPALKEEPVIEETMALRTEKQPGVPSLESPVIPPTPPVLREAPPGISPSEERPQASAALAPEEAAPPVVSEQVEEAPPAQPTRPPEAVPPAVIEPISPTAPFLQPEAVAPPAVAKAAPPHELPVQPSEEALAPSPSAPPPPVTAEEHAPPPSAAPEPVIAEEEIAEMPIRDVFFDYDQFVIRSDAVPVLTQNATLLLNHYSDRSIVIEGHCDERGTQAYNLVLGKRRAQAVKEYLQDLGVPAERMEIVSYGKERPFCTEHSLQCWQQNRRAHFVLK